MTNLSKRINKEHEGENASSVAQDQGNCWIALKMYAAFSNIMLVHTLIYMVSHRRIITDGPKVKKYLNGLGDWAVENEM